jgi:hypothetical protein
MCWQSSLLFPTFRRICSFPFLVHWINVSSLVPIHSLFLEKLCSKCDTLWTLITNAVTPLLSIVKTVSTSESHRHLTARCPRDFGVPGEITPGKYTLCIWHIYDIIIYIYNDAILFISACADNAGFKLIAACDSKFINTAFISIWILPNDSNGYNFQIINICNVTRYISFMLVTKLYISRWLIQFPCLFRVHDTFSRFTFFMY